MADAYALYERRMVEASAMDFDDLLVRTVNLLELFEDVRERYQRTFRWILVDEYQDTNRAQYRLLQLLAGEQRNLTVVGDEDQIDLQLPRADVRNILEFDRDFADADGREARGELPLDRRRSSTPRTRIDREQHASRSATSTCSRTRARATSSPSPSSTTSTARPATSPARSSGSSPTRATRATTSRSSTG